MQNENEKNFLKQNKDNIRISSYILAIYIIMSLFNNSPHGAGLGKVIIPIILYIAIRFSIELRRGIRVNYLHFLVFIFWLFSLISTMLSQHVEIDTDIISSFIFTIFFVIATSVEYNKKEVRLIIKSFLLTGFFASIFIIFNFITGNQTGWAPRYSLEILGVMKDENYVSAFLMPILALSTFLLFSVRDLRKPQKFLLLVCSILISFAALLTGSRAAFVSVILVYALIFGIVLFRSRLSTIRKISLSMLGIILIIIVVLFADKILPEMISERLFDYQNYSLDVRFTSLWKTSFSLFYDNPILGSGLNSIPQVYGIYSHSVYIDLLVGQGVIGFLLFCAIIVRLFKNRIELRELFFILVFAFTMPLVTINGLNTTSIWTHLLFIQILRIYFKDTASSIKDLL